MRSKKLQDLGSLLQFLQICRPLDKEDFYKRLLLRPLTQGAPEGAELLRVRLTAASFPSRKHIHKFFTGSDVSYMHSSHKRDAK
jgi:SWI/SNF-related matrix-associated actin-dependent regulator of chromatin subfamily A3